MGADDDRMPKPIISWTIGAVAITMLGAGLLTAAQAVDTSPDPQVVLTTSNRRADDRGRATSTTVVATTHDIGDDHAGRRGDTTASTTVATTATSLDDHGVDDPATHDVGDDHGTDDTTVSTTASTTATSIDDHGGTSGGHGSDG